MFVLTKRMIWFALAGGVLVFLFFLVANWMLQFGLIAFLLTGAVFLFLTWIHRKLSLTSDEKRHHRASLEFSYDLVGTVVAIPVFFVAAQLYWPGHLLNILVISLVTLLGVAFRYFKNRKRLKDYRKEEVFL